MGNTLKYKALRGMPDILPAEAALMRRIEEAARAVFRIFGYEEIITPIIEETEVFTRSIGEDTDIVEKEMYSFTDRGGKNISLRPEGTASIIRAYIEHGWYNTRDIVKLFYAGPMFRGERPQKGRQRQFHQIGAEIIGPSDPHIDAELIFSLNLFLKRIGICGFTVLINSLGCDKDRDVYKKELKKYLNAKLRDLCENCRKRSETNVLRVLDCKNPDCKTAIKDAPDILSFLCTQCRDNYDVLKKALSGMEVPYVEKKDLVRGLDYYTGSIFEVVHPLLGAQDALAAGGRYDGLCAQMGGPDTGATGYAVGVERLLLLVEREKFAECFSGPVVMPVEDEYREHAFKITCGLWAEGIPCEMNHSGKSLKSQLRKAHKDGYRFVVMIGEEETKSGDLLVRDMVKGEQEKVSFEGLVKRFKK